MEESRISFSKVTFTILIDVFVDQMTWKKHFRYNLLWKYWFVPDVYTYGILIHGLCMKVNMKAALKLFKRMSEMHLEPNDLIYKPMFLGYCKG